MPSLKILVGSQNPVKVAAAKEIFTQYFPEHTLDCQGMHAPSGVPDQPLGEDDTRIGAENRVKHLIKHYQADFYCAWKAVQISLVTALPPLLLWLFQMVNKLA